jgi:hypothetical protein
MLLTLPALRKLFNSVRGVRYAAITIKGIEN